MKKDAIDVEAEMEELETLRKKKVETFRARIATLDQQRKDLTKAIDEEIGGLERAIGKITGVKATVSGGSSGGGSRSRRSPEQMAQFTKDLEGDGEKLLAHLKKQKGEGFIRSADLKSLTKTGLVKKALEPLLKEKKVVVKGAGAGTSFAVA